MYQDSSCHRSCACLEDTEESFSAKRLPVFVLPKVTLAALVLQVRPLRGPDVTSKWTEGMLVMVYSNIAFCTTAKFADIAFYDL